MLGSNVPCYGVNQRQCRKFYTLLAEISEERVDAIVRELRSSGNISIGKNNLPLSKEVLEEMVSSNSILDVWRSEGGDELARRFVRSQRYIDLLHSNMDKICKSDRQMSTARICSDINSISAI
jgi:hypothetical protein